MKFLKTPYTLKYYISLLFFLCVFSLQAQQDTIRKDTIPISKKQPVKIRVGWDIGKFIWAKLQQNKSLDFYVDANFYKDYYLIFETGTEEHLTDHSLLKYTTKGNYFKLGIDYNMYRNWLDMDNDISIGIRYGQAFFDYQLMAFAFNQPGSAYPPQLIETNENFNGLSAGWVDLTTKIQTEIFSHFYLGYALSLKYLVHTTQPDNFDITYIPGFFNKNTYANFEFGMQYFISYQIKF